MASEVKRQSQALVLPCDRNLCSEGAKTTF